MLSVVNEELTDIPCTKGDIVIFTFGDGSEEEAEVTYGLNVATDEEDKLLSFAKLKDGRCYLVGINGKFFPARTTLIKTRMKTCTVKEEEDFWAYVSVP